MLNHTMPLNSWSQRIAAVHISGVLWSYLINKKIYILLYSSCMHGLFHWYVHSVEVVHIESEDFFRQFLIFYFCFFVFHWNPGSAILVGGVGGESRE